MKPLTDEEIDRYLDEERLHNAARAMRAALDKLPADFVEHVGELLEAMVQLAAIRKAKGEQ